MMKKIGFVVVGGVLIEGGDEVPLPWNEVGFFKTEKTGVGGEGGGVWGSFETKEGSGA